MAIHEIDGRVLAYYGIMQPALDAESHLNHNYGIGGGFEGTFDRQLIVTTITPVDDLDNRDRLDLLGLACAMSGIAQLSSDAESIRFRARYITMMERSNGNPQKAQPHEQIDHESGELSNAEFTALYIEMMQRPKGKNLQ